MRTSMKWVVLLLVSCSFIALSAIASAATRDEVIAVCFAADDGTETTAGEVISLRLLDMGGGYFVGSGKWIFSMDTLEVGDEDIDFELSLMASAITTAAGTIELNLIGSDFERSVAESTADMRFTRVYVEFDSSLIGTGKGFTEDEIHGGGSYTLTLTPIVCPE